MKKQKKQLIALCILLLICIVAWVSLTKWNKSQEQKKQEEEEASKVVVTDISTEDDEIVKIHYKFNYHLPYSRLDNWIISLWAAS